MKKKHNIIATQRGFSVLEVLLAVAIFALIASSTIITILSAFNTNRLGTEETIANQFSAEGMDAARSIKNQSWTTFAAKGDAGNQGVALNGGTWAWSGTSNLLPSDNRFSRVIVVSCIQRDASGNISGSIACNNISRDDGTRKVVVTTTWNFLANARTDSVVLTEYMTNWKVGKGGMLVYGDATGSLNTLDYEIFNASSSAWSPIGVATMGSDTGAIVFAVKVYASATRNEKIVITRQVDTGASPSIHTIWAEVYNGTTGTWGNVNQLSGWQLTGNFDVQNFDGTYLANGDFMAVASDNTAIPKFKIWNGSTWSASSIPLQTLRGTPVFIAVSARPNVTTNEVMAAFFESNSTTQTEYFNNSSGYATASWALHTTHSITAPVATKRFVDFTWNATGTVGALIFSSGASDTSIHVRTGTSTGGATPVFNWGSTGTSSAQTNTLGAVNIAARPNTANEFIGCDKDAAATPTINCWGITHAATPTFSAATAVAAATDTGIERSFQSIYKQATTSGNFGITVYSDNTSSPKFKRFTSPLATWGSVNTIATTGFTPGIFNTIRTIPQAQGDDIMTLLADANNTVYSVVYSATGDAMFVTPPGKAFSRHGTHGSGTANFWFDFVWDKF